MALTREQFLISPAAHPPPGIQPNFENPRNTRNYLLPLFIAVATIANLMFLAKLWVLVRIVKRMLLEDWLLAIAWVVYAGAFCTVAALICNLPVGMHQWDMNVEKLMRHLFLYNCAWIIYGILMILIKVNILLQYIRIFVPGGTRCFTSVASYALIVLNVVYYMMFVFMLIFSCLPRRKIWDITVKGHCIDWRIVLAVGNIATFVSDVIIWAVPQRIIWRLHLERSQKWGLSALFTIGVFAIVCSGVRIQYQVQLLKSTADITYVGSKVCLWGTCQLTEGFMVACIPTMPQLCNSIQRQPWAGKMRSSMRTLWKRSKNYSVSSSTGKVDITTIRGGRGKFRKGGGTRVVTDVEFDELVNRTELSVATREEDAHSLNRGLEQNV